MNDDVLPGDHSVADTPPTKTPNLLNHATLVEVLTEFLRSPKPPDVSPVDVLQVVELLLHRAVDHPVYHSQQTLAQRFGCDEKTIVRSQARLEKLDWLSRPQRKGRTRELTLNFAALPGTRAIESKITIAARQLTANYQRGVQKRGRMKFPKHWLQHQLPSAQRILDHCSGDRNLAAKYIAFALDHPKFCKKAAKSLYEINGRWSKIIAAYEQNNAADVPQKGNAE